MMNGDENSPASFSLARRWGAGLNLVITVAAVFAIIAMVNYLGMRHFVRANWTHDSDTELSARTRHVLASLTNQVKVITYYDSEDPLFMRVRALLKEYENASGGKVRVQYVDRIRQPAAANAVKTTYNLASADRDVVIFDGLRHKIVNAAELSDYDTTDLMSGKSREVTRTHFKGEMLFTSKVYECSVARSPKAYFLVGNGEHLPSDAGNSMSYSKFAGILKDENNFDVQTLDLVFGRKEVPADCNLLIIAGPLQTLEDVAVDSIGRYLDAGGRLLVLFNFRSIDRHTPSGLEKLLATWGVEVTQSIVLDPENATDSEGKDPIPVVHGVHPIVNSLGSNHVHFILPRALHAVRGSAGRREEAKVDELLFTGEKSEIIEDLKGANRKRAGAQPLAVVVEKTIPALERGSTRIVAIGDSTFWSNQAIDYNANRDFAAMTVDWLVQQNVLLTDIPRRAIRSTKLTLTQSQLTASRWLLLVAMPAMVLLVGSVVWLRRRT